MTATLPPDPSPAPVAPPVAPPADDKDWTWTITRPCSECGYQPASVDVTALPETLDTVAERWSKVLRRNDVGIRPEPQSWSPLEYAGHVRDVFDKFTERVRLMLDFDNPRFENWDQDQTALEKRYWEADPVQVTAELAAAARLTGAAFAGVRGAQWERPGLRSNGSPFTVRTLGVYLLHDVVHHLHDVRG